MAQSVTETFAFDPVGPLAGRVENSLTLSMTSDTDGSVEYTTQAVRGVIHRVTTNPGSTAPTDNWDITVSDENGIDVLASLGANRDTTNSETVFPVDTTSGFPFAVSEPLAVAVTNAGDSKTFSLTIYFR